MSEEGNGPNGEWLTPKKARAKVLVQEAHMSISGAARVSKVPRTTLQSWLKNPSDRRAHSKRTGRPSYLTKCDVRRMIQISTKSHDGRRLTWKKLGLEAELDFSSDTIR